MADFTVVTCSCGQKLQIPDEVDYYTCKHCGAEFIRRDGVIYPLYQRGTMRMLRAVVDVPVVALFIVAVGLTLAAFLRTVSTEICLIAIGLFVDIAAPMLIVFRIIERTSCPACGSVLVRMDRGRDVLKRHRDDNTVGRAKKDRFGNTTLCSQEQISVEIVQYRQNFQCRKCMFKWHENSQEEYHIRE